jgi:hypothetical protein
VPQACVGSEEGPVPGVAPTAQDLAMVLGRYKGPLQKVGCCWCVVPVWLVGLGVGRLCALVGAKVLTTPRCV